MPPRVDERQLLDLALDHDPLGVLRRDTGPRGRRASRAASSDRRRVCPACSRTGDRARSAVPSAAAPRPGRRACRRASGPSARAASSSGADGATLYGSRDHAVLGPLDDLDLAHLRLDVAGPEAAVDDADAPFLGLHDGHRRAGDRVHVGRHDRAAERRGAARRGTTGRSPPDRAAPRRSAAASAGSRRTCAPWTSRPTARAVAGSMRGKRLARHSAILTRARGARHNRWTMRLFAIARPSCLALVLLLCAAGAAPVPPLPQPSVRGVADRRARGSASRGASARRRVDAALTGLEPVPDRHPARSHAGGDRPDARSVPGSSASRRRSCRRRRRCGRRHATVLKEVSEKYGVPPGILVVDLGTGVELRPLQRRAPDDRHAGDARLRSAPLDAVPERAVRRAARSSTAATSSRRRCAARGPARSASRSSCRRASCSTRRTSTATASATSGSRRPTSSRRSPTTSRRTAGRRSRPGAGRSTSRLAVLDAPAGSTRPLQTDGLPGAAADDGAAAARRRGRSSA